jgi:hypothetical protein
VANNGASKIKEKGGMPLKCIKKRESVRNVSDVDARRLVSTEGWSYCPRHEWKEKVRGPIKKD